jgi:translation elongation factor P/translation initiation factor 5A
MERNVDKKRVSSMDVDDDDGQLMDSEKQESRDISCAATGDSRQALKQPQRNVWPHTSNTKLSELVDSRTE